MTRYCTVAQAKQELLSDSTNANLTTQLLGYANVVSKRIDNQLSGMKRNRPFFAPYLETRAYTITPQRVNSYSNTFLLNENLLSFSAITIDGSTFTGSVSAHPPLQSPFQELQLSVGNTWYYATTDSPPYYVKVTGLWGYHSDYDNAWVTTSTLSAGVVSTTATTITVTSGTNFSQGHLIRINSEYMEVTAISTNTLTVTRGVNGTTATAHTNGDNVDVFVVEPEITRICARQCALMVARQGAFQVETLDGVGAITYPQDMLTELWAVIQEYQYD